jgi:hypothetical protein
MMVWRKKMTEELYQFQGGHFNELGCVDVDNTHEHDKMGFYDLGI